MAMEARKIACARREPEAEASEDEEMEIRSGEMVSRQPLPVALLHAELHRVVGWREIGRAHV